MTRAANAALTCRPSCAEDHAWWLSGPLNPDAGKSPCGAAWHLFPDRSTPHEHPGPVMFTCECGSEYTSAIAAMYCCDVAAPGPADDDHMTRPHYVLGYD